MTYGTGGSNDIRAHDIVFDGLSSYYTVSCYEEELGKVHLNVPGLHHVRNSLAALAAGIELGIPFSSIVKGLELYQGVKRRFEVKGEAGGVVVVDDYAHHPTEIKATIKAARDCWKDKKLIALFEPHRYTRTRDFMDDFAKAFKGVDELWITEIYPASEEPIVGVSGERLGSLIMEKSGIPVHYVSKCFDLPQAVAPWLMPGDVVLAMGAGNIGKISDELLRLQEEKMEKKVLAC
jgi:UDP-N-acetylmuramate--alanine ligase